MERLTLRKNVLELGTLLCSSSSRVRELRCSAEEAWLVRPLVEVVLAVCCNYASACLLVGLGGEEAAGREGQQEEMRVPVVRHYDLCALPVRGYANMQAQARRAVS